MQMWLPYWVRFCRSYFAFFLVLQPAEWPSFAQMKTSYVLLHLQVGIINLKLSRLPTTYDLDHAVLSSWFNSTNMTQINTNFHFFLGKEKESARPARQTKGLLVKTHLHCDVKNKAAKSPVAPKTDRLGALARSWLNETMMCELRCLKF